VTALWDRCGAITSGRRHGPAADAVALSLKEVSALASRVLEASGWPVGSLAAAAAAVQQGEVIHGGALAAVAKDLRAGGGAPPPGELMVRRGGPDWAQIDAHGGHSLFFGPAAADLACALADAEGTGLVMVSSCAESAHLAAAAWTLAARGYGVLAIAASERRRVQQAVVGTPGPAITWLIPNGASGPELRTERLDRIGARGRLLPARLGRTARDVAELVDALLGPAPGNRLAGRTVVLVCCTGDEALELTRSARRFGPGSTSRHCTAAEVDRRRAKLLEHGVELDRPTWIALMDHADQTLVPTSEQSRREAG
jgi:hypothetical protein